MRRILWRTGLTLVLLVAAAYVTVDVRSRRTFEAPYPAIVTDGKYLVYVPALPPSMNEVGAPVQPKT